MFRSVPPFIIFIPFERIFFSYKVRIVSIDFFFGFSLITFNSIAQNCFSLSTNRKINWNVKDNDMYTYILHCVTLCVAVFEQQISAMELNWFFLFFSNSFFVLLLKSIQRNKYYFSCYCVFSVLQSSVLRFNYILRNNVNSSIIFQLRFDWFFFCYAPAFFFYYYYYFERFFLCFFNNVSYNTLSMHIRVIYCLFSK